jgi:Papain-like cysteine protease AvrRpt2
MSEDKYVLSLPMQGNSQPNSKTCWYACYAMMYAWKGIGAAELDRSLSAAGYQLSDIKNRGLKEEEYGKVAHAVGTRDVLRISAINWSIEDIVDRLQRWGPIFLCTMELGGGHAMVLYGVDLKLNNLIIADPYSVGGDYGSAHNEFFSLKKFQGTIQPVEYAIQVF